MTREEKIKALLEDIKKLKATKGDALAGLIYDLTNKMISLKGEKGDPRAKGNKGDNGESGAPGRSGKDGQDGKPGRNGKDGKDGRPGRDGRDGIDGINGKDGKDADETQILKTLEDDLPKLGDRIRDALER